MSDYNKIMLLLVIMVLITVAISLIWINIDNRKKINKASKRRAKAYRNERRQQAIREARELFDCYVIALTR